MTRSATAPEVPATITCARAAAAAVLWLACSCAVHATTWQAPLSADLRAQSAALALAAVGALASDAAAPIPTGVQQRRLTTSANLADGLGSSIRNGDDTGATGLLHSGRVALLVERRESKRQSQALIDTFVYHYEAATLHRVTVQAPLDPQIPATSQAVVKVRQLSGVQLPLTPGEVHAVRQHLQQHGLLQQALATEYQRFHPHPLDSDQLDYRVAIWNPAAAVPTSADPTSAVPTSADPTSADPTSADPTSAATTSAATTSAATTFAAMSAPAAGNALAQQNCTQRRCALVAVFTRDMFNFATEPVVDLATGEVWLDALADPRSAP